MDEQEPTVEIIRGSEAISHARDLHLPEPTVGTQHALLSHARYLHEHVGPGCLFMIWEQLDPDGHDVIHYLQNDKLHITDLPEVVIAEITSQVGAHDWRTSFVLVTIFPKLPWMFCVRTYHPPVLPPPFVVQAA